MRARIKFILTELRYDLVEECRANFEEKIPNDNWNNDLYTKVALHISSVTTPKLNASKLSKEVKILESIVREIITYKVQIEEPSTIQSLERVCIYLGYKNWNEFYDLKNRKMRYIYHTGSEFTTHPSRSKEDKRLGKYLPLIQAAKQAEFDVYANLPVENYATLKKYYKEGWPEWQRILRNVWKIEEAGVVLNTKGHKSKFSIDQIVVFDYMGQTGLYTREYWHMEWCDMYTRAFKYYTSLITLQIIYLTKDNKIESVEHMPYCNRDMDYVERVYKNQTGFDKDDDFLRGFYGYYYDK